MRKVTRNAFTIVSFGVLGVGYAVGANAQTAGTFSAASAGTPTTTSSSSSSSGASSSTPSSSASASASQSQSQSANPSASQTTSAPAPSSSKSTQPSSAPKPSSSSSSSAPASASSVSKTGAAINYRYGTVQLTVVKSGSTITAINLVQAGATGGRQGAFPYLVKEALAAQSASIANLGGATFTTQAFEQALSSALGKF